MMRRNFLKLMLMQTETVTEAKFLQMVQQCFDMITQVQHEGILRASNAAIRQHLQLH